MVPSHLFQFIFLHFPATPISRWANGCEQGQTEVWGLLDYILPARFHLCGTSSKTTLQTPLTILGGNYGELLIAILKLSFQFSSGFTKYAYHDDICSMYMVYMFNQYTYMQYMYIVYTHTHWDFVFWLLSSVFTEPSKPVITLSEGLALPLTCQPVLKLQPLKWLLT